MMPAPIDARPTLTPPDIEAKEFEWWQQYAEYEERFAWVHTPSIQRILRGHYLKKIVSLAGRSGSILDLGCGMGWLSLMLARAGASRVTGIDFSPAQIAIAKKRAIEAGLDGNVEFQCMDGTQSPSESEKHDCVVIHGFLHHLNKTEIARTIASIPQLLKPGGHLVVFEPVRHSTRSGVDVGRKWKNRLGFLIRLSFLGMRYGFRRISPEEQRWRTLAQQRNWGHLPHGPSPKEMPFAPGELDHYLSSAFVLEEKTVVMALSHLVVQDWLLRQLSHPLSSRLILPIVTRLAARWDRLLVAAPEPPSGFWVFTMFSCRLEPSE